MRQARLVWNHRHGFTAASRGHRVPMDVPAPGGDDGGPTPKELVLMGLGGCTGMDVAAILGKMRQPLESFEIDLECEDDREHPRVFRRVNIVYRLTGEGLDPERARRAVELSMGKYCGVSAMIAHTARITWTLEINGRPCGSGSGGPAVDPA
ncbi:MAG TPA: OsmC family protein [Bacillota bacterium]